MAIEPRFIEQLKSKCDLVDVVSKYSPLQQKGGNLWACCPLPGHNERTPSFCINRYGQFYKCFGCGRGGDVISFIMEMESLPYMDAVKHLAEMADMELPTSFKEDRKTSEDYKKKDTILSILKDTAMFYVNNLRSGNAHEHEAYLKKRGLTKQTVTAFGIGASLDYYSLPKYLKKKGYSEADMISAGVVSEKENEDKTKTLTDFEGKRLIFPIINAMGEVIAFGGRVMEKTDFGKYKNTRETLVFVKNKTLYNINRIKKLKAKGPIKEIIMVEGYMDAISLSTAGFENVVASMGTSLTKEQARLLKRYTENVLICYDGDFAGQSANIRGLEILKAEGLSVKVVSLPDGMDPDDVIKKLGAGAYEKCLEEAMPLVDFKLKILRDKFMNGSAEGKRRYLSEAVKVIRESASEAEREDLLRKISKETNISYQSIRRDMENRPVENVEEQKVLQRKLVASHVRAERFILARMISKRPLPDGFVFGEVDFEDGIRMEIAAYIADFMRNGMQVKPSVLYDYLGEEGREEAEEVLMTLSSKELEEDVDDKFFFDCVKLLKKASLEKKLELLKQRAESQPDLQKRAELTREIMETTTRLRAL